MKPNADMITKILSDLRVNGKVAQDRLLIGKGSDEVLTFGSGNLKVRYTPQITGGRTFTVLGSSDHDVYDEVVILKPYPKPSNSFSEQWILPASDTIWISDNLQDPNYSSWRLIMFVGRTNAASGNVPTRWALKTVVNGSGAYGIDWATSNVQDFLGVDTNITWSNGEASSYPTSVNDWSTDGAQAKQPEQFSMSNVEGSIQKLEYTTDGSTWHTLGEASNGATVVYEPIEFDQSYLSNDGKITIQHNFNDKNVLCLGYTPQPKEIEYLDNQIVLDYSDQNSSNFTGAVWFVNSAQSMLVIPGVIEPEEPSGQMRVSGAGISDANGIYTLTSGSTSEPLEYTKEGTSWVIDRTMGYDSTHTHVNWSIRNTNTSAYAYASESFGGAEVKYPWELTWAMDPDGVEPVPTVEQYTPPEHNNVVITSPIYVSGSHPTQVNCDGKYETYDGSAASTVPPSGSTTVVVYFTMDGGFQITVIQNDSTGEVTFYLMDVSSQMDDAVVYFVGHPSDTSTNHYDPTQAVWSLGPEGVDPIPKFGLQPPGVYVISGAGTADVNGTYWAVPTEEWSNIFNGTTLNNMQHCWTNGTYYLCDILSQYPYPSRTIQIMGYEYVDGVASGNMVNFYTCAPFSLDGDITTATFQVAHGDSPAPTVEKISSVVLPDPSIRISNCGVEEANGDYSIIPEQYWDQYVDPTYLQNHTVVQLWTNGTGVLETNGAEPYIYPVGSDPSKVDPWYAGVVSTDPNDPLTVSVWITLDNGIAPVPTLEAI